MKFVHIGLHKSGSTFLQSTLFAQPQSCTAVIGTRSAPDELHDLCRLIWSRDHGDLDMAIWIRKYEAAASQLGIDQTDVALSDENLSGHMLTGVGRLLVAERLAHAWPEAKILIVLRNPIDYTISAYDEYCRLGGASSLRTLLYDRTTPGMALLRKLDFASLVARYIDFFGSRQVLVLPYELLLDDQRTFVNRVASHCGIEAAPALSKTRYNSSVLPIRRVGIRLANFSGIPRTVKWERRSRPSVAGERLSARLRDRARVRVRRLLRELRDADGVVPQPSGMCGYVFEWEEPLMRSYQELYKIHWGAEGRN